MAAAKKAAKAVEPEESTTLTLDGETLDFDISDLTFGEAEFIEAYFGLPLEEVDFESGRGLLVIAYTALKRKKPDTTLDDVRDMKISSLSSGNGDDADPPTEA